MSVRDCQWGAQVPGTLLLRREQHIFRSRITLHCTSCETRAARTRHLAPRDRTALRTTGPPAPACGVRTVHPPRTVPCPSATHARQTR
eukprot:5813805-Prymnesium_polylepis.1